VLNVRPTNSTSSRLNNIGSTVSFQNDAVGDGKIFTFLFFRWFLDESGGNKTLRKWEHWLWGCKIRVITDNKLLSYLDSLFARRNDDEDDNDGSMSVMHFANALVWEIIGPAMAGPTGPCATPLK